MLFTQNYAVSGASVVRGGRQQLNSAGYGAVAQIRCNGAGGDGRIADWAPPNGWHGVSEEAGI